MTAAQSLVLSACDGAVLRLTLNRPNARNALSEALMSALMDALDKAAKDKTVRVIVLAAGGVAFCAGHDLKEMRALAERCGDLVGISRGGDRRVLSLTNPSLGGRPYATSTLWGAVQYLRPGEVAPAHRHTPGALRFVPLLTARGLGLTA